MLSMLDNGRLKRRKEGLIYSTGLLSFSVRGKDERQLSFCGGNSLNFPPPIPAEHSGDMAFDWDFCCLLVGVEVEVTETGGKGQGYLCCSALKRAGACVCFCIHTSLQHQL